MINVPIMHPKRYVCISCNKRQVIRKHGRQWIELKPGPKKKILSQPNKKITEHLLKGKDSKDGDVVCNKCRHRLITKLKKGICSQYIVTQSPSIQGVFINYERWQIGRDNMLKK